MLRFHDSLFCASLLLLFCLSISAWAGWDQPVNLGSVLNSAHFDGQPFFSPDGKTIYFTSNRPGGMGDWDIWISRLIGSTPQGPVWSEPQNPGPPLNSPYQDGYPCLSQDGQTLYFSSTRPGGMGGMDIFVSTWTGSEWGEIQNLGSPVNAAGWELAPFLSQDGQVLYFGSAPPGGGYSSYDMVKSTWQGSVWSEPENLGPAVNSDEAEYGSWVNAQQNVMLFMSVGFDAYGGGDIFLSQWTGSFWGAPSNLGLQISTEYGEGNPFLTADFLTLYVQSNRPGGHGDHDIYVSHLHPEEWDQSINLGPLVNSQYDEGQPSISSDGRTLYFASERPGGIGSRDIWVSNLLGWSTVGPMWSPPNNPGIPLNSVDFDSDPCVSSDGQFLYFMSSRPPASWSNTDIFVSQWVEGVGWAEPENIGLPPNSSYSDRNPTISSDGETLYFSSVRPGGYGGWDIYKSMRFGTTWLEAENLGPTINTAQDDDAPWVSAGEAVLYFNSSGHSGQGEHDLFCSLWIGAEWGEPIALMGGTNTIYTEGSASLTPEMRLMYHGSDRPGGWGGNDLFVSFSYGRTVDEMIGTELPSSGIRRGNVDFSLDVP